MKINVDTSRCIGAGHCVVAAPSLIAQNGDDGLVVLLNPDAGPVLVNAATDAARLCPTGAIVVASDPGEPGNAKD